MKKALRYTLFGIISIILIAFTFMYFKFNNYSPSDGDAKVDQKLLNYYHKSYKESRMAFLLKAKELTEIFPGMEWRQIRVDSKVDTNLIIDVCFIPPKKEYKKLMILTSGTHGIEGFTGSAVQTMVLDKIKNMDGIEDIGFLFIHALNPYGFKYGRKVTENNVDLNRNCVVTYDLFSTKNSGFEKLNSMLTPEGKVNLGKLKNQFFHIVAIAKIIKESMPILRQAALQGQYDFPGGIYYGGKSYEMQIRSIKPIIKHYINLFPTTLNIDLHTGYGKRGKMHLFINPIEDKKVAKGINEIFKGVEIDYGSGDNFYTINGIYTEMVSSLADSALVLPMLFEFGTMNSQETFGSLKSIHTMILENQGANFGYKNEKTEKKVKSGMMELYCPTSQAWKSETIRDANVMFDLVFKNLKTFNGNN